MNSVAKAYVNTFGSDQTLVQVSNLRDSIIGVGKDSIKVQLELVVFLILYSASVYPWLALDLPPRCPQVVWCRFGGNEAVFCHPGSGRVGRL